MTAFDFVKSFPHLPCDWNGNLPIKPSNSCIRRWLDSGAILINGVKPKSKDLIEFPVWQMIFFPKNPKKRCTFQNIEKV